MSEIEKMYKTCNIKKYRLLDRDHKLKWVYPPFTAEKQIELIKWLAKGEVKINNEDGEYEFSIFDTVTDFSSFEESLADLINRMWQSLAEEEKQQIKEILE